MSEDEPWLPSVRSVGPVGPWGPGRAISATARPRGTRGRKSALGLAQGKLQVGVARTSWWVGEVKPGGGVSGEKEGVGADAWPW